MTLSLSLREARRLALVAQGFSGRRPRIAKMAHVTGLIERLGVLQIDSVNALVRSHYLPLFSRLGPYQQGLLEQAAWSQGRRRSLFEYWGHEASLLPLSLYPLLRWRMRRARNGEGIYKQLAQFAREQQPLIAQVLHAVRERGALGAGSLGQGEARSSAWWGWSAEKHALEWLFAAGEVTVAGRRGFERLYDLPERVLPAELLEQPELDVALAQRQLLLRAAQALGVATEKDLRDYYRLDARDSQMRLAELLENAQLQAVRVQGWTQKAYCLGEPKIPRKVGASALLSPFDSLIWERARTERLFGFRYRIEIYTPAPRRQHGYYVLPFLMDGALVARVDLKSDRQAGVLRVQKTTCEETAPPETRERLAAELALMADWLGLGA
jgi:uncharacterized protein YcaQ